MGLLVASLLLFNAAFMFVCNVRVPHRRGAAVGGALAHTAMAIILIGLIGSNMYAFDETGFMLAVEIVAVPLFYFFFMTGADTAPTFSWVVLPLLVGTVGMAGIGTMLSTITMNTRSRDVMLAVLFIPLIYPLLYACVTATAAAITGAEAWTDLFTMPLVLACGYDIVILLVCWVLYDFVVSA